MRAGAVEAVTTDFIVDSIIIVMENYGRTWKDLGVFLSSLYAYKGLKLHYLNIPDRIAATEHMREHGLDFDDATTLQAMKVHGIEEIVSYDDDFDILSGVRRRTPEELG